MHEILYHGTTHEAAARILETRELLAGDNSMSGGVVWLTENREYAALYGPAIIEIPRSALPANARAVGFGNGLGAGTYSVPERMSF